MAIERMGRVKLAEFPGRNISSTSAFTLKNLVAFNRSSDAPHRLLDRVFGRSRPVEGATVCLTDYRSAEPFHLEIFGEEVAFDPAKDRWIGTVGDGGVKINKQELEKLVDGVFLDGNHAAFAADGTETDTAGTLRLKVAGNQSVLVVRKEAFNKTRIIIAQEGMDGSRAYRLGQGKFFLLEKAEKKNQYEIKGFEIEEARRTEEVDLQGTEGHAGTVLLPGDIVLFNLGRQKQKGTPLWLPVYVEPSSEQENLSEAWLPAIAPPVEPSLILPAPAPVDPISPDRIYSSPSGDIFIRPDDLEPKTQKTPAPKRDTRGDCVFLFPDKPLNGEAELSKPQEDPFDLSRIDVNTLPTSEDLDRRRNEPFKSETPTYYGPQLSIFFVDRPSYDMTPRQPIPLEKGITNLFTGEQGEMIFEDEATSLTIEYGGKKFMVVFYSNGERFFLYGEKESEFKGIHDREEILIGAHKIHASRFSLPPSFPFDCFSIIRDSKKVSIKSFVEGLKINVEQQIPSPDYGPATIRDIKITPAEGVPVVADRWGERVVAIGDVHGELDGLKELLKKEGVFQARGAFTLVQEGDVIDRGPESMMAFKLLRNLQSNVGAGKEVVRLFGNHELLLLQGDRRYVNFSTEEADEIVRMLKEDIAAGKVLAAYAKDGVLYTHAELRLPLYNLLRSEIEIEQGIRQDQITIQQIADRINKIFRKAVADSNYSHQIFGVSSERGGRNAVGGIFWEDGGDPGQNQGLGFLNVFAHTPPRSGEEIIRATGTLCRVNVDAGMHEGYGGNRAYLVVFPNGQLLKVEKKDGDYVEKVMK